MTMIPPSLILHGTVGGNGTRREDPNVIEKRIRRESVVVVVVSVVEEGTVSSECHRHGPWSVDVVDLAENFGIEESYRGEVPSVRNLIAASLWMAHMV